MFQYSFSKKYFEFVFYWRSDIYSEKLVFPPEAQQCYAMQILQKPVSREELKRIAENTFGDMVKCVADVHLNLLAIDAELHADLERLLLDNGSAQEDLWGFNLWVEEEGQDFVEFDSLINIRAWQGNPSRDVLNPEVREAIKSIVAKFITA